MFSNPSAGVKSHFTAILEHLIRAESKKKRKQSVNMLDLGIRCHAEPVETTGNIQHRRRRELGNGLYFAARIYASQSIYPHCQNMGKMVYATWPT
jgi:hypothetical protein